MINRLGQVMVYVNNQDKVAKFWTDVMAFSIVDQFDNGQGFKWIEVAPSSECETSLVLHSKEFVAKMAPELHLGTPSLMFFVDDLDDLYSSLVSKSVTVGEIVTMPTGRVFNFADNEGNYFAVAERKPR